MHFKMIIVFVEDEKTDAVMDAARDAGATGATVITSATRALVFIWLSDFCARCWTSGVLRKACKVKGLGAPGCSFLFVVGAFVETLPWL